MDQTPLSAKSVPVPTQDTQQTGVQISKPGTHKLSYVYWAIFIICAVTITGFIVLRNKNDDNNQAAVSVAIVTQHKNSTNILPGLAFIFVEPDGNNLYLQALDGTKKIRVEPANMHYSVLEVSADKKWVVYSFDGPSKEDPKWLSSEPGLGMVSLLDPHKQLTIFEPYKQQINYGAAHVSQSGKFLQYTFSSPTSSVHTMGIIEIASKHTVFEDTQAHDHYQTDYEFRWLKDDSFIWGKNSDLYTGTITQPVGKLVAKDLGEVSYSCGNIDESQFAPFWLSPSGQWLVYPNNKESFSVINIATGQHATFGAISNEAPYCDNITYTHNIKVFDSGKVMHDTQLDRKLNILSRFELDMQTQKETKLKEIEMGSDFKNYSADDQYYTIHNYSPTVGHTGALFDSQDKQVCKNLHVGSPSSTYDRKYWIGDIALFSDSRGGPAYGKPYEATILQLVNPKTCTLKEIYYPGINSYINSVVELPVNKW